MNKDTLTLIISITAIAISAVTFLVAYSQMKIASTKIKLDLYHKRFNVFVTALDYYQATIYKSHKEIKEQSIEFVKSYRESQFLFDDNDGIYETLNKILQNGSVIYEYEKHKYERDNNLTRDRFDLGEMHNSSIEARTEFEKNLINLEKQIKRYIEFKSIAGWEFF